MNRISPSDIDAIADVVHKKVQQDSNEIFNGFNGGSCLAYAYHGIEELRRLGFVTTLGAGSAYWLVEQPTTFLDWFGYTWVEENERSVRINENTVDLAMPCVHCWITVILNDETVQLVDFSTTDLLRVLYAASFPYSSVYAPPKFITAVRGIEDLDLNRPKEVYHFDAGAIRAMNVRLEVYDMIHKSNQLGRKIVLKGDQ